MFSKRAYLRTYARHGMKEARHGMKEARHDRNEAVAAGGAAARQCLSNHALLSRDLKRDIKRQEVTCEPALLTRELKRERPARLPTRPLSDTAQQALRCTALTTTALYIYVYISVKYEDRYIVVYVRQVNWCIAVDRASPCPQAHPYLKASYIKAHA